MKKYLLSISLVLILIIIFGCKQETKFKYVKEENLDYISNQDENATVKNIILIIGDGMGENHVRLTKRLFYNDKNKLDLDKYEYKSTMETSCLDHEVTDSAASATALATGVKTLYETVGMDKDGNELKTILDYAFEAKMSTGVVTDQDLNDATPVAFTSHSVNRYKNLKQMINDQITGTTSVLFGLNYNAYSLYKNDIIEANWSYVNTKEKFIKDESNKLFATFDLSKGAAPSLEEMMQKAIKILSTNTNGFFLMLEAGNIDEFANNADFNGVADAIIELDKALRVALNFMRANDNTIVVVLADHETGGLEIKDGVPDKSWFTSKDYYHTSTNVPVYAFGTRSNVFNNKELKNSDILGIFLDLLNINK